MRMFFDSLICYGDNAATVYNDLRITYSELHDRCLDFMQSFEKGKHLAFIFCRNDIDSLIAYLSCLISGNVPALIGGDIETSLAKQLIERYEPEYIYGASDEAIEDHYKKILIDGNKKLIKTGFSGALIHKDLALLLTTSGSTGSPKFVRQSYDNINSNAKSIVEYLKIDQNERAIMTLPMNYTYGLSVINSHLMAGAEIIFADYGVMQKEFWETCRNERATSISGVPYTYEMLKKIRFFNMELNDLKTMTQAGGKLDKSLHYEFAEYARENGKRFVVMYGQTEATARMTYLPAEKSVEKAGSIGIPIPGGEVIIEDEKGEEINVPNVSGELVYRGPNVTLGYAAGKEDLAKGDERHGVLHTGDVAQKDEDGYLYIVGRYKRFLKIYGNRVNLDEIEQLIKTGLNIYNVSCIGRDDNMTIAIEKNCNIDDAELIRYISKKTGINKRAFNTMRVDQIPKNSSGKTNYSELEKLL